MDEFKIGTYIRKGREDLGISQEELCQGLCSVSSLSRIENNQQNPSRNLTQQLLGRLGLPSDRFIALWGQKDIAAGALMREVRTDILQYSRLLNRKQPQMREKLGRKLKELTEFVDADDQIVQQYLLAHQALIGGEDGPYSSEEKLAMQLEAIRLTCPKFDPEDFQRGHYSIDESRLINQIANTYSEMKQRKRAIDMYRQLLKYIEKNDRELSGYAGHFCLVAHNYAIDLTLEKRHPEAVEIAEKGRKVCLEFGDFQFLPGFLAIQAECYYFLNEKEKCKELYRLAYYTYAAFGDETNREIMRQEIKKYLKIDMTEQSEQL